MVFRPEHALLAHNAKVQDALVVVVDTLKQILKQVFTNYDCRVAKRSSHMVEDDQDGFAPMRVSDSPADEMISQADNGGSIQTIFNVCIDFLVLSAALPSAAVGTNASNTLVDMLCACENTDLLLLALEPFLRHVQHRNHQLPLSDLDKLLVRIEEPLMSYRYANSDALHVTIIHLLEASMAGWLPTRPTSDISGKVYTLIKWFIESLRGGKLRSWRTRDTLGRFLEQYIRLDPSQRFLTDDDGIIMDGSETLDSLIPFLTKDEDMRVRFTAARAVASLFSSDYAHINDPMAVYTNLREQLCIDLSK